MALTQREQKTAKIAGVFFGVVILYYFIIEPLYEDLSKANESLAESQQAISENQLVFSNDTKSLLDWNKNYNKKLAKSPAAADSQLNDRIRQAAQSERLEPQFEQSRSDIEKGFGKISRPIQVSGKMPSISRFVYQLQNSDIPIRINELTMATKKDGTDDLTVTLNVATIYELPVDNKSSSPTNRQGVR